MRIPEKKVSSYPLLARIIFWAQKKKYGESLLPSRIWGYSPPLLYGLQAFYRTLDRKSSPLPANLRALINVLISKINHCSFCIDIGTSLSVQRGASLEKINSVLEYQNNPLFSTHEQAALKYAEVITKTEEKVTDTIFQNLRIHFTESEIVELTALIAFQNMSSKFNAALDIPSQGFCEIKPNSKKY